MLKNVINALLKGSFLSLLFVLAGCTGIIESLGDIPPPAISLSLHDFTNTAGTPVTYPFSGTVWVHAYSSTGSGSSSNWSNVTCYIDGTSIGVDDASDPSSFRFHFDPSSLSAGSHTVTVKGTSDGQIFTSNEVTFGQTSSAPTISLSLHDFTDAAGTPVRYGYHGTVWVHAYPSTGTSTNWSNVTFYINDTSIGVDDASDSSSFRFHFDSSGRSGNYTGIVKGTYAGQIITSNPVTFIYFF
jgi:hypothetical protein